MGKFKSKQSDSSSLVNGATSAAGESWIKLIERGCQIFSQIKEKYFQSKYTSAAVKIFSQIKEKLPPVKLTYYLKT